MNGFERPHASSSEENNPAVQESIREALNEIEKRNEERKKADESRAILEGLLGGKKEK